MDGLEEGPIVGIKGMQLSHGGAGLRSLQGRLTVGLRSRYLFISRSVYRHSLSEDIETLRNNSITEGF
jgi:hypothetical protein